MTRCEARTAGQKSTLAKIMGFYVIQFETGGFHWSITGQADNLALPDQGEGPVKRVEYWSYNGIWREFPVSE